MIYIASWVAKSKIMGDLVKPFSVFEKIKSLRDYKKAYSFVFPFFLVQFYTTSACTFFKKKSKEPLFVPPAPEVEKPNPSTKEKSGGTTSEKNSERASNNAAPPNSTSTPEDTSGQTKRFETISGGWKLNRLGCMQHKFETGRLVEENRKISLSIKKQMFLFHESGSKWQTTQCTDDQQSAKCCVFTYIVEATVDEIGGLHLKFAGETPQIERNGLPVESCTATPLGGIIDFRYEKTANGLILYGKNSLIGMDGLCTSQETISIFDAANSQESK